MKELNSVKKFETITLFIQQKKGCLLFALVFTLGLGFFLGRITSTLNIPVDFTSKAFIMSEPPGASVMIDGHFVGKTPLEVRGKNDSHSKIEIKKNGHQSFTQDFIFNRSGGFIEAYLRELSPGVPALAERPDPRMPPLPYFNQTHDPGPARSKPVVDNKVHVMVHSIPTGASINIDGQKESLTVVK